MLLVSHKVVISIWDCTNPGMTDGMNHLHRFLPHQPSVLRTNTSLCHDAADAVREGDAVRFDEHFSKK